jgi:hypothetical protein
VGNQWPRAILPYAANITLATSKRMKLVDSAPIRLPDAVQAMADNVQAIAAASAAHSPVLSKTYHPLAGCDGVRV